MCGWVHLRHILNQGPKINRHYSTDTELAPDQNGIGSCTPRLPAGSIQNKPEDRWIRICKHISPNTAEILGAVSRLILLATPVAIFVRPAPRFRFRDVIACDVIRFKMAPGT